ncbi:MAG: NAD(P)H-dependent oxidoreductase subunit E [Spirochaetaceae bacterium]
MNSIGVCRGIACQAKGAGEIYQYLIETLGENSKQIIPVRCLGDCGNAPIVIYNCKTLIKQTLEDVKSLSLK